MFYTVLRVIIRGILLIWRRWQIIGLEHLPAKGGVVVVSNHISNLDPVVVGCALTRPVHFMAKVELFKIPVLSFIIKILGAFPVNREKSDRNAIRKALEILQRGSMVGVFPEGTRSKTGQLQKAHIGAAMLAVKADVPILPVALKGTKGWFKKITVVIGEPVYLPELWRGRPGKEELEALSQQVMGKISNMMK
ncbi:MAG: lysophospholipid acyltransferase family protein [Bacillota bacterium]|nr:1-acyl-sn-glycerol-3-phosphate acyltransferase [Bacillota bacterium]